MDWSIVSHFIPKMLEFSDRLLFKANVNPMFTMAVSTCYKYKEILGGLSSDIVSFFIHLFMIPDKKWKYLEISSNTLSEIITYIGEIKKINKDCKEFILSLMTDALMIERVNSRTEGKILQ